MSKSQVQFPSALTLDGKEYTTANSPELKQFFEQVATASAQRAKDTLYETINNHTTQNQALSQQLSDAQSKLAAEQSKVNRLRDITEKQMADYDKLQNEVALIRNTQQGVQISPESIRQIMVETFQSSIPALLNDVVQPIRDYNKKLEVEQLSQYRERKIQELQGQVIAEMIHGETINELDASIAKAHELYKKYNPSGVPAATTGKQIDVANGNQQQTVVQPKTIVTPVVSNIKTPNDTGEPDYRNMSPDDYAKNRDTYKQRLEAMLSAAGPEQI